MNHTAINPSNIPSPTYNFPHNLFKKIVANDLKTFLVKSYHLLHPKKELVHNWHIDYILAHLEAITRGELKRLIINLPP